MSSDNELTATGARPERLLASGVFDNRRLSLDALLQWFAARRAGLLRAAVI